MKSISRRFIQVLLLSTLSVAVMANKNFVDAYYENLKNGSLEIQLEACKKISDYSGITDKRVFDLIETKLLNLAGEQKPSRQQTKNAVCFTQALASSGNERYRESLQTVSEHAKKRKLRKSAEEAIKDIKKFARWNSVINSDEFEIAGRSGSLALWMRLVNSGQADMGLYAIEKVQTFGNYDLNFLILLEEKLQEAIPMANIDENKLKFYGVAMHYLMAHPEFGKYTSLVNEIAEQAKSKKLVKLAHQALSR